MLAYVCTNVLLDLMSGLERFHNELFTENYCTSPLLFQMLYERGRGVNACGTVGPSRRGFPHSELFTKATGSNRSFSIDQVALCLQLYGLTEGQYISCPLCTLQKQT